MNLKRGKMIMENAIEVSNLQKRFNDHVAVDNISFEVKKGEIFGLLGPNGAGKTTILKMVTTLLRQDAGKIMVNGFNTLTQSGKVRQQFGLTGQGNSIDQDLSAMENLIIFGRLNGLSRVESRKRANMLLKNFDLVESSDKALATFSGGMRRRLDLAVSLIGKPSILFLDEPTTGLDPRTRNQMWDAIRQLVNNGATVVLTTQYLEEADQLADHIALIDHGKMIATGSPTDLKQETGGLQVKVKVAEIQYVDQVKKIMQDTFRQSIEVNNRQLTTTFDDTTPTLIVQLLKQLQNVGVLLSKFAIEEPSLDDVFLKMTVGKN